MTDNTETPKRVAIITGASRGIGASVASRLAADGIAVVINYSRSSDEADALVDEIGSRGGAAISVQADISDPAAVANLFDAAEEAFGGVDILVNNAGIMRLSPIANTEDDEFDAHVAVNLKGVFNTLRQAGKRLRDGGHVVNFSSSVVGLYQPTYGVYAATKAGVEALTHIFSKEVRGRRITVNAVAPGPVNTPLFTDGKSEELIAQIAKLSPFERIGEPDDIASAISFLVGSDGGWVNGQVLRVNGGAI